MAGIDCAATACTKMAIRIVGSVTIICLTCTSINLYLGYQVRSSE